MLFIIIGELKYFRGSFLQFDQGLSISENQSIKNSKDSKDSIGVSCGNMFQEYRL